MTSVADLPQGGLGTMTSLQNAMFQRFARGLDELDDADAYSVIDPYRQITTVFRGILVCAHALVRVPFELWRGDLQLTPETITTEKEWQLYQRCAQPNPAQTWEEFIETLVIHYHTGNAYMYAYKGDLFTGVPKQIILLPPNRVSPIRHPDDDIYDLRGWSLKVRGGERPLLMPGDGERVMQLKYASNPEDPWVGIGPYAPAQLSLDADRMASLYQRSTLRYGGNPGSVMSYKGGEPSNTETELPPALKMKIENDFQRRWGGPTSGGRLLVLNGDWNFSMLGFRPRDMEFLSLKKYSVEEHSRMLNVPPFWVGHYEGIGWGQEGMRVQERALYEMNTIPLGVRVAKLLNKRFIQPIDPTIEGVFNFDHVEALREDLNAKLDAAKKIVDMGGTLRRANERVDAGLDVDDLEWADHYLVPAGMTTAEAIVQGATLPEPSLPGMIEDIAAETVGDIDGDGVPDTPADKAAAKAASDPGTAPGESTDDSDVAGLLDEAISAARAQVDGAVTRAAVSKAARQKAMASFLAVQRAAEAKIEKRVRRVMKDQRDAVLKALVREMGAQSRALTRFSELDVQWRAPKPTDTVPPDLDVEKILRAIRRGMIAEAIKKEVADTYMRGGTSLYQVLLEMGVPDKDLLDFQSRRLPQLRDRYLDRRLNDDPQRVDDTTREIVNRAILNSLEDGKTLHDTAQAIRDVFNASLSRATTIARTETTTALNAARYQSMQENLVEQHMWLSAGDQAVRDSHADLNGTVVVVGDEFKDGLKFPGDPDCPDAGEVINCRCTTRPVTRRNPAYVEEA